MIIKPKQAEDMLRIVLTVYLFFILSAHLKTSLPMKSEGPDSFSVVVSCVGVNYLNPGAFSNKKALG